MKACPIFALVDSSGYLAVASKLHPEQAYLLFVGAFSSQGQRNEDVTGLILGHQDLISLLEGRFSKMPLGVNRFLGLGLLGCFFLVQREFVQQKVFWGKLSFGRTPTSGEIAHCK